MHCCLFLVPSVTLIFSCALCITGFTYTVALCFMYCQLVVVGDCCLYCDLRIIIAVHCALCFVLCALCIIVSCALQATGSTCSVASARRGGSGVTRREYAPPPDHLSYKEFSKEKNAECLDFRFSICKEFSTVPQGHVYSSLSFALSLLMSVCRPLCLRMVVLMMMLLLMNIRAG